MGNTKISLNPALVIRTLSIAVIILVTLSILSVAADFLAAHDSIVFHKLKKLFYVDLEMNVPAFFSSLILLAAALILAVIAVLKRKQRDLYATEWMVLAGGFLFMAFDELIAVHERLIEPVRDLLGSENFGIFYFAWVIPMGLLVFSLAILFFRFWLNLPFKTRLYFLIAAFIYLGGAIGFELIESKHCEIYGKENAIYIMLTTVEETLEMSGVILFINSLLKYMTETFGNVQLQLDGSPGEAKVYASERLKTA